MDDAATRLGRFFLIQLLLNAGFGTVIAAALFAIGVPHAVLWGILSGVMRFVPFIGSIIAAFFPVVVAAAADPGWSMPLMTAALFLVAEPTAGQIVEPLVYGPRTGLSPVAVVLSTLFWTLLWGPIGLLLATPLTVCLVVLGKYIEGLKFIDVLLGDDPPLLAEERLYQRLLSGDATDAAEQAEDQLKTRSLSAYYDEVAMKALILAQADAAEGKLLDERQHKIQSTLNEIIDDLSDYSDQVPSEAPAATDAEDAQTACAAQSPNDGKILCIATRSVLDGAAAAMLAQILEKRGLAAALQPIAPAGVGPGVPAEARDATLVCLSHFGAASRPSHVRYLIRRLKRLMPHTRFIACFWMLGDEPGQLEEWKNSVGADFAATSLNQAAMICCRETQPSQVDIAA